MMVITLLKKIDLDVKKISGVIKQIQKVAIDVARNNPEATKKEREELTNNAMMGVLDELMQMLYKEIICKLDVVDKDIKKLLIALSGMTQEELEDLPFEDYIGLTMRVAKSKGFTKLFKSVM